MKHVNFVMLIVAVVCLVSCNGENPSQKKEKATNLISLADQVLSTPYSSAVTVLLAEKFTQDAADSSRFVRADGDAYIALSVENDTVKVVEATQDHAAKADAIITQSTWSKYAYKSSLPAVSLWFGQTYALQDTLYYIDGQSKPLLNTIIMMASASGSMDAEDLALWQQMQNNSHSSFLLNLEDEGDNYEMMSEQGMYSSALANMGSSIDLSKLDQLMQLFEGEIDMVGYMISTSDELVNNKQFYRTTYYHLSDYSFDMGGIMPME